MKEPIKATIYCIVENNEAVLLTEDEGKSGWKLPGGEVEERELLLNAARREVKEETGLDVELIGVVSIQEYIKEGGEHRLRFYLSAKLEGGEQKLMEGEIKRLKWFSKQELRNLKQEDFFIEPYYLAIQDYLAGNIYPITIFKELNP